MASTYVTCPKCGASNESRSTFCANCGTPLQANGATTLGPLQERQSSPIYPGNNMPSSPSYQTGGANIPPPPYQVGNMPSSPNYPNDGQFYPPSPYPTNDTPPSPPPATRRKRKIGLLLIIAALVIVLIAGGALAAALLINPSKPTSNAAATGTRTTVTPNGSTATTVLATNTTFPAATTTDTTSPASTATTQASTPAPQTALPCTVNVGAWTDGSSDWKVLNGMLLNDGTNGNNPYGSGPSIVAPCQPATTANYAIETKIQVISGSSGCFGITVRGNPLTSGWQGYMAGVGSCDYNGLNEAYIGGPNYSNESSSVQAAFSPGTSAHTYRVEAKNNTINFYVDNSLLLTLTDNRYLTGAQIGFWDQNIQLQVTSFQVTAL